MQIFILPLDQIYLIQPIPRACSAILTISLLLYFPLTERAAKGAMGPKHGKLVFAKNKNHEVSPLPPSIIP
jgi:hypothetical protein